MRIAWSSEFANTNGRLTVSVRDGNDNPIVTRAGFADFWGDDSGTRSMDFPACGGALCNVPSSLPESGSALVEIGRTGNTLTFVWDSSTIFSTIIGTQPAEKIELGFLFFDGLPPGHMVTLSIDFITVERILSDADGDGIPDDADDCPESDLSPTVVIDGCNAGVINTVFPSGCKISDLIAACAEGASNHGEFVSCVSHVTNDLKKAGTITGQQKGAIQRCAAQTSIP